MADSGFEPQSDVVLRRYLLGRLSDAETERLDQQSVTDPAFAERLLVAEHDLADAYARGELDDDERTRWDRLLGSSADGREQLRLARALTARNRIAPAALPDTGRQSLPSRGWIVGLAAAAVIALAVGATFFKVTNDSAPAPVAAPAASQVAQAPEPPPSRVVSAVALTLVPPTRDASTVPLLTLPAGTTEARVTIQLEPTDFARFSVSLRDLSSRRTVWTSGDILPSAGNPATLQVTIPAAALHRGLFAFDVEGAGSAAREPIGSYPLRVKDGP